MNHVTERSAATEISSLLPLSLFDLLDPLRRFSLLEGGKYCGDLAKVNTEVGARNIATQFHDMQLQKLIPESGYQLYCLLAGTDDTLQFATENYITRLQRTEQAPAVFPLAEFKIPAAIKVL